MISTQARGARAEGRRPASSRPEPRRAPELAHLTLQQLRDYRQELASEETRISYWRRILQARLDSVIAPGDDAALARLRGVLDQHADSSRRLAMLPVATPDDAPPLPNLTALWETTLDGAGHEESLVARLAAAEQELSSYRHSLHARLDAATGELISRYRDYPALALGALPLGRRPA
ncbi:MAG: RsiG family protein [Actinomycetes bacterium]